MTAAVDALRNYVAGGGANADADADTGPSLISALRKWGQSQNDRMKQFGTDAETVAQDTIRNRSLKPTSDEAQAAQGRMQDFVGDQMNVGGLTTWHGTPATLVGNRFDPAFVGTGEGAQAFGHGAYVAQRPGIAKGYQMGITRDDILNKGKTLWPRGSSPTNEGIYNDLMAHPDLSEGQKGLLEALHKEDFLGMNPLQALREVIRKDSQFSPGPDVQAALKNFGSFYKVDLPDPHINKMLNWDTPLSAQPDVMANIVKGSNDPEKLILRKSLDKYDQLQQKTGRQLGGTALMRGLINEAPRPSVEGVISRSLAKDLGESNVPGVKYLDNLSRDPGTKNPTSNFVVFPTWQDILQVQERNGVPISPPWGG